MLLLRPGLVAKASAIMRRGAQCAPAKLQNQRTIISERTFAVISTEAEAIAAAQWRDLTCGSLVELLPDLSVPFLPQPQSAQVLRTLLVSADLTTDRISATGGCPWFVPRSTPVEMTAIVVSVLSGLSMLLQGRRTLCAPTKFTIQILGRCLVVPLCNLKCPLCSVQTHTLHFPTG